MDVNVNALDECMEFFHDEGHDAASTSHNFLERSKSFLNDLVVHEISYLFHPMDVQI